MSRPKTYNRCTSAGSMEEEEEVFVYLSRGFIIPNERHFRMVPAYKYGVQSKWSSGADIKWEKIFALNKYVT